MFFKSVFAEESDCLPGFNLNVKSSIEHVSFPADKIKKKLDNLNPYKSPGPDELHPRILIELSNELSLPLSLIFSKSFSEGELPQDWKGAIITPLHKKGEKEFASNYGPISLTSIVCKVMESIIKDDILAYMVSNKLLTNLQHGFVPGKSCQSNLLLMLNFLTELIENETDTDLVYLDFAKAFDSVPHNRLICKLHNYGFSGHLLLWIRNFLSHRRQKVRVNNTLSNWENVSSSVPQGSVFGPILFIIYINDLPRYKMFADDTKLMQKLISTTSHNELQDDINRLIEWSKKWELKFNTSKCKVMHFGNDISNSYTMLDFNDQKRKKLEFITEEKDLGVIIDHKLNFSSHIVTQVKKANKMMGLIRRSYTHLDITSFR